MNENPITFKTDELTPEKCYDALDEGKVLRYSTPFQGDMYFRKVSDVGRAAYESEHPQSQLFVHSAHKGKLMMGGIVESSSGTVVEIVSLEEAQERGVFEDNDE